MQKQIPVREAAVCAAMGILAAAAVFFAGCGNSKEDSFRSVQIYGLEGTAQIERQESGVVNAVENLYLEAQDRVSVAAESSMRLKLDDDKYVLAEENTVFSIQAEGSAEDSRTTIELEQGGITSEIQNSLSGDSRYEVETPNSVMAVRGTVFRVEATHDENGDTFVKVTTFEGSVSSKPLLSDGTYGDEVIIEAGKEVVLHSDSEATEFLGEPAEIDYSALPPEVLSWLDELTARGVDVRGITKEGLNSLISGYKTTEDDASGNDSELENSEQENTPETTDVGFDAGGRGESVSGNTQSAGRNGNAGNTGNTRSGGNAGNAGRPGNSGGEGSVGEIPGNPWSVGNAGNTWSGGGIGNPWSVGNAGNMWSGGNTWVGGSAEIPGEIPTIPGNPWNGGPETPTIPGNPDLGDTELPGDGRTYCTVTFLYQGNVFATQTVERGNKTVAPKLSPAAQGEWDFDFSQDVCENTTINWKE